MDGHVLDSGQAKHQISHVYQTRASAFQAEGRGFDPRLPLQIRFPPDRQLNSPPRFRRNMALLLGRIGPFCCPAGPRHRAEGEATMPSRTRRKRWQDVKKQDIPLENALRAYLLHHEDMNHSPKTVRTYSLSLIHISEPTRLGMISYAVFCLKKKKKKKE